MPECEVKRPGRGDGDCNGPIEWQVIVATGRIKAGAK